MDGQLDDADDIPVMLEDEALAASVLGSEAD